VEDFSKLEVSGSQMKVIFTGKNFDRGLDAGDRFTILQMAQTMGAIRVDSTDATANLCICVDYWPKERRLLQHLHRQNIPLFLIKQEPPVILPEHASANPHKLFTGVYTRGVAASDNTLRFPNSWEIPSEKWSSGKRKRRFIAISADKWSAMQGELYSLRRQIYTSTDLLDVYGRDWSMKPLQKSIMLMKEIGLVVKFGKMPLLPDLPLHLRSPVSYLGTVAKKTEVMSSYDYSLVIENSADYMSEKLMDALLAGTLPVYVGPEVDKFGIPPEFTIQVPPEERLIKLAMKEALQRDTARHREALWDWLSSDSTKELWHSKPSNSDLLEKIFQDYEDWRDSTVK